MGRSVTLVASVHRYARVFNETVIPWQALSGIAWLAAGVVSAPGPIRVLSDWTVVPLVLAVICGRFSGMCWNRLIDCHIDARNPRTSRRAVPSGRLSQQALAAYALVTLAMFLFCCAFLAPTGQWIGIAISISLLVYSFTKRYTIGCHFFLGLIYACLPLVGALWQCDSVPISSALLSIGAFASVAGSDIVYAVQDEVFDRRYGLYSIPARFGTASALDVASALHAIAIVACSFALIGTGTSLASSFVWLLSVVILLVLWRAMWTDPSRLPRSPSMLAAIFSFAPLLTLAANRLWLSFVRQ